MLPNTVIQKQDVHRGDFVFYCILQAWAVLTIILFLALFALVFYESLMALKHFGLSFFFSSEWDSWKENFGALSMIWGTVVSSCLALLIAIPISLGAALFLNEIAPAALARPLNFCIEMLAAVPSIVYGLWGLFVLAPVIRSPVQEFLGSYLGFIPLFQGPHYGVGMLTAGIVLSIMIIPTITSISREVFQAIPYTHKESVLGIGATRWEMFKISLLKGGRAGLIGAVIMGLGRALGETMAVTMVIGNKPSISLSLFEPAQSMASILANQYAEADSSLHLSSLTAVALALLVISLLVHLSSSLILWRTRKNFS